MVELLCAGLIGARYAHEQSSFFSAEGAPPGTGQLLIALDVRAFSPDALDRLAEMAGAVEADAPARLPGRRRQALRARLEREGIPVDPVLLARIEALAEGRG
jgi:(2R)-3-sulfolactate dehydrogenase (NADP+)